MVSSIPLPPTQRTLDTGVLDLRGAKPRPGRDQREDRGRRPTRKKSPSRIRSRNPSRRPRSPRLLRRNTSSRSRRPPTKAVTGETAGIRIAQSTLEVKNGTASVSIEDRTFGDALRLLREYRQQQGRAELVHAEADPARLRWARAPPSSSTSTATAFPRTSASRTRSGSPTLDLSALRAVQRVDGFGPLPAGQPHHRRVHLSLTASNNSSALVFWSIVPFDYRPSRVQTPSLVHFCV